MRKWIIGAAAALAVALPGMAAAQTTANLGFNYANHDSDDIGDDVDAFGLDGAFAHDFGNGWTVQGDGAHDRVDSSGLDLGVSYGAINLGMRNENHSIYGFVGLADIIASSSTMVGVGGQWHLSQATLNGSVGFLDVGDALISDLELTSAHIDGTWFLTDNLGITGQAAWTEAESSGNDADWTTLGIGASYRVSGTPWTVSGEYQNRDADFGDVDTFRIRVAFAIGTSTAREEAQGGPSWNGAESLYDEARVLAIVL
jgi:hypothetical protein